MINVQQITELKTHILYVVIMHSIVDSIINAFSSLLRSFDPKRRVSPLVESFSFNTERLMLLILSKRVRFFYLSNLSSGERSYIRIVEE